MYSGAPMSMLLMNSRNEIEFCTPYRRFASVRLEGSKISGQWEPWEDEDGYLCTSAFEKVSLLCEFLNWGDDEKSILRWTKRYGPLSDRMGLEHEFSFDLGSWRRERNLLKGVCDLVVQEPGELQSWWTSLDAPTIGFTPDKIKIVCRSLIALFQSEVWLLRNGRLRRCGRNECVNPYFVTAHAKQQYCSALCAATRQRDFKTRWWKEKGAEWAKKQKKKKGIRHGTGKKK